MQRLTEFTINRALKHHGYLIPKAPLHRVFLFSLAKNGHYAGTLFSAQPARNENKVTPAVHLL